MGEGWFCLAECWPYQLGVLHGENAAAATVQQLVARELERVFNPALLRGWPVYRCDWCQAELPQFTSDLELDGLGWRAIGRDAHLCPACQPRAVAA